MCLPRELRNCTVTPHVVQPTDTLEANIEMYVLCTHFVGVIILASNSSVTFASAFKGCVPVSLRSLDERGTHESGVILVGRRRSIDEAP